VKEKLKGALGLLKKSGMLTMGFDPVAEAAAKGNIFLIVLAEDLSPKSAKEIRYIANKHNVDVVTAPVAMDEIWYLLGRRTGILGAANEGLAHIVRTEISRLREEE
jgi:ribosomal protein L7Ae-like RNA K-turn-binding protein